MRARRLPLIDEYVEGDEVVVFVGDNVIALSPLATAALLAVGQEWTHVAEVSAVLLERFGSPPEGVDAVEAAQETLRSLAEHAIVEVG
jgi:hypothetical protein